MAVGRPREFDPDRVEDAAMRLFWERGFDGVSISDVSDVTGVNRRGVYAEFGTKENLFARTVQRYLAGPGDYLVGALARPTAREVAEVMVHGAAEAVSGDIRRLPDRRAGTRTDRAAQGVGPSARRTVRQGGRRRRADQRRLGVARPVGVSSLPRARRPSPKRSHP